MGDRQKPRVCLAYQQPASFISMDSDLLKSAFEVQNLEYHGKRDLIRLARAIHKSRVSMSWFALGHATASVLLSRWIGKKSVVAVGGWDVAAMPEIPYGAMLSASRRRKTILALRDADTVIAPSQSSRREAERWVHREIQVVPLAIDTDFFAPGEGARTLVATVASVTHEAMIRTKGLDVFLEAASELPRVPFVVIGNIAPDYQDSLKARAPSNVRFTGWLERAELRSLLRQARVYVQLSAHESFGLAVGEAMATGSTVIVSDRGALPEVVGDTGSIVPYGDPKAAVRAISIGLDGEPGGRARARVLEEFSMDRRRRSLERIVGSLV